MTSNTTIYVENIPLKATNEDLENVFSDLGPIKKCFVVSKDKETNKGFGYVNFALHEDATTASQKQVHLFESKLKISMAKKRQSLEKRKRVIEPKRFRINKDTTAKVIVRNLPFNCSLEDLKQPFLACGKIKECHIPVKNGKRGFGIIQFHSRKEAEKAVNLINSKKIKGRKVAVDFCLPQQQFMEQEGIQKEEKQKTIQVEDRTTVFVRNVPLSATSNDLKTLFSTYGTVVSCSINKNKSGISRGTAFVCFLERKNAKSCLKMNSSKNLRNSVLIQETPTGLTLNGVKLVVNLAITKEEVNKKSL